MYVANVTTVGYTALQLVCITSLKTTPAIGNAGIPFTVQLAQNCV